jgi:hypothetical protein
VAPTKLSCQFFARWRGHWLKILSSAKILQATILERILNLDQQLLPTPRARHFVKKNWSWNWRVELPRARASRPAPKLNFFPACYFGISESNFEMIISYHVIFWDVWEAEYKQAVRRPAPLKNWKTELNRISRCERVADLCLYVSVGLALGRVLQVYKTHTLLGTDGECDKHVILWTGVALVQSVWIPRWWSVASAPAKRGTLVIGSKVFIFIEQWIFFFLVKKQTKSSVAGWTNRTTSKTLVLMIFDCFTLRSLCVTRAKNRWKNNVHV